MTQDNFWNLIQTALEHGRDEDHDPFEIVREEALTAALLGLPSEEIAAFEQIFRDYSALAHRRISEVRQHSKSYYDEIAWDEFAWEVDSLIGWTMVHGQREFLGWLADPLATVLDFDYEITEDRHEGADLRGLAPRAYQLKTGHPLSDCEFQAHDGAEQGSRPNPLAFGDSQRLADVLPSLRAVTAGVEKLSGDVEAVLEELKAAQRGVWKGGADGSPYLLTADAAPTRGLLNLLSTVMLLMPRSLLD